MPYIVEIFGECSSDGIKHRFPCGLSDEVLETVWDFLLQADSSSCIVASVVDGDSKICGYCLVQSSVSQLVREGFSRGLIPRLAGLIWSGKLPVGLHQLKTVLFDLIAFGRTFDVADPESTGQVLSIGVQPQFRGEGMGTELVRRGLEVLEEKGIYRVKLEVRPGNEPARRIYDKMGFEVVGSSEDSVGKWLIMIRECDQEDAYT